MTSSAFTFSDADDFQRFREVLRRIGYEEKDILEALGINEMGKVRGSDVPLLLRRTSQGTPLETLIRLFLIEVPVEAGEFRRAIEPMGPETWVQAGLVQPSGGHVAAAVKLLPFRGLVLAFDLPQRLKDQAGDYVMGVGSSSMTLANLTIRRHATSTLDLGTGCGIQALLAAEHSDRVLAVDRNPRAVRLASFNAGLNGLGKVECVEGDLFEPAQGQTFDLVVSNPPFVISPEESYIYRDSGLQGDEVCRKIVREVPRYLREGGYCQMICNWVEKSGEEWQGALESWFEDTGCDVWVLRSETADAETYATTWIRHTELQETPDLSSKFDEWMAYYERLGIEGVSAGVITMRNREGPSHWFRAEDAPQKMLGPSGDAILRGFELTDFLQTIQDESALLDCRLRVSPDLVLESQYAPSEEGWKQTKSDLWLGKGLAYAGKVDRYVEDLVIACNGRTRLRDIVAKIAAASGAEPEKISEPCCDLVRRLVERGFLLPEELET
jgi:methylase of polypeptide subunit release factors